MSSKKAYLLCKRAEEMFEGAKWRLERGHYDLACFEAEQAAQLWIKCLAFELWNEAPRLHDLNQLLGFIMRKLSLSGKEISSFVDKFRQMRKDLWFLSESYYEARYEEVEYGSEEGERCLRIAEKVRKLVEEVRRAARGGVHDISA